MDKANAAARFHSFKEFYPFYLQEHSNSICRRLHFIGSSIIIVLIVVAVVRGSYGLLWYIPLAGYGCAWVGHFFFEHNRPATFKYPFYSLLGDWVMYRDMLVGRVRF